MAIPKAQPKAQPSPAGTTKKATHRLTPKERSALGKEARGRVPRSSHAAFVPSPSRPDPVSLLEGQAVTRVPELVPIRYGRMLVSPFTFYRGAALVMASDLAGTPRSGLTAQICGDAHLSNFGLYASPERSILFDVNDFDETLPGPFEWDLKRLAASIVVAGRDQGFSQADCATAARAVATSYRTEIRRLAAMRNLDVWYSHVDVEGVLADLDAQATKEKSKSAEYMAARATSIVTKSRTKDSLQALDKLTTVVDGKRRFVSDPPLLVPVEDIFPEHESDAIIETLSKLVRSFTHSLQSDRRHLVEDSSWSRWRARSSGSAASGPGAGSCSSRARQRRSADAPGQGGRGLGPRAVRRQEPVHQPRRAGRGRTASDAGRQRHLLGLAAD